MASTNLGQDAGLAAPGTLPSIHQVYQDSRCMVGGWTTNLPKRAELPAEGATSAQHALIARYTVNYDSPSKTLDLHSIVIQSKRLKKALPKVLGGYTGITLNLAKLEFNAPFEPFVRRWERLTELRNRLLAEDTTTGDDQQTLEHLKLLYSTLHSELAPVLNEKQDMLNHDVTTFKLIWTIFEPGCLIYRSRNGHERLYKLNTATQDKTKYILECVFVDYDGKSFGMHKETINIPLFRGTKQITTLEAYPLQFHQDPEAVRARLTDRGRKFEAYIGTHFVAYKGIAIGKVGRGKTKFNVNSRIIVDPAASVHHGTKVVLEPFDGDAPPINNRVAGVTARRISPYPRQKNSWADEECVDLGSPYNAAKLDAGKRPTIDPDVKSVLTEEQLLLADSKVRGYSLRDKRWMEFYIDNMQDIVWDDEAFSALVAPPEQKDLILAFTEAQAKNRTHFDDFIQGKGKGIIMLLSGPPGVGKTLTAESVAETMRVPLYTIGAAELGSRPAELEEALQNILEMCTKWNAVLLLDEADVFMESRSSKNLERNKLVAIFLRLLEYFEGIMFLTTNRLEKMDTAFESRIHLSLNYEELDKASRRQVWSTFLGRVSKTTHVPAFTEAELDKLAKVPINGRQIKNVLKTAQLLADRYDDCLEMSHIETVLRLKKVNEKRTVSFFGGE